MSKNRSTEDQLPSLRIQNLSLPERVRRLVAEMEEKSTSNQRINLSVPPHNETTIALNEIVYIRKIPGEEQKRLRIEYNDGSLGKPIPIHALVLPENKNEKEKEKNWGSWQPKENRHLHIGTLSLRHVDYDPFVDFYLIRDKETRNLSQGDIDALAYDRMLSLLGDSKLQSEFYITIFQAGLEPLAVGIYRALVEHMQKRKEPLRVASIFGLNDGKISVPKTIWGIGDIKG